MSTLGKRIIASLDETIDWVRGKGTMSVHFPGEPGREMTFDEYHAHKSGRETPTITKAEPFLRLQRVESYTSRSGWPFWLGFTPEGRDAVISTEQGVLRVTLGDRQIFNGGPVFSKENMPTWDEIKRLVDVEGGG